MQTISHRNPKQTCLSRNNKGEYPFFGLFRAFSLFLPQVGFVWLPDERACVASNVNGIKLTLTVTLIIDTVLLVTVLVGLLRLRRDGGGKFGLQGLLWKQVW